MPMATQRALALSAPDERFAAIPPVRGLARRRTRQRRSTRAARRGLDRRATIASVVPGVGVSVRRRCTSVASTSSSASEIRAKAALPTREPRSRPEPSRLLDADVDPGCASPPMQRRRNGTPPARPCFRRGARSAGRGPDDRSDRRQRGEPGRHPNGGAAEAPGSRGCPACATALTSAGGLVTVPSLARGWSRRCRG